MRWILGVIAAAVTMIGCGGDDGSGVRELGQPSDGITLNVGTWEPGNDMDLAGFGGIVRVDTNGCVHLAIPKADWTFNVVWPAGYTAAPLPDGAVQILDPDGVVVAESGMRLRAGGGQLPRVDLSCRAQGTNHPTMGIQTELPGLTARSLD